MFTGLVEEVGTVTALDVRTDGARLRVRAQQVNEGLALGDSVAVDGACLTVVAIHTDGFEIDAVSETLTRTTLGGRGVGDLVNLERAVRVGDRLGGHLVQGHVDGVGEVTAVTDEGTGCRVTVHASQALLRYVVEKGSITIDGVSLVTNYRAQFDRVIKASSYRDLVVRMQGRVGAEMPRPASGGELLGEMKLPLFLYEMR